jgi:glycosyltransferase involved in cell wall biosynthesis
MHSFVPKAVDDAVEWVPKSMHVALLGTYPPQACGIATFTADLHHALQDMGVTVTVIPVTQQPGGSELRITRDNISSYRRAALRVNALGCDVVIIEHEFGIFGGDSGSHLLAFTEALTVPFAVTMHTVLPSFSESQARVVAGLAARSVLVTVFTTTARTLLVQQRLVRDRDVAVVPHGAPRELYQSFRPTDVKDHFGIGRDRSVVSTFGLLSEGKGIELALSALVALGDPNVVYVVAGRTHPEVVRHHGEKYRDHLHRLVGELGLENRVVFVDRFMNVGELASLLGISDVFLTPYRGEEQSVSGALTFALAAGCPVVSTPYRYAIDVLADL